MSKKSNTFDYETMVQDALKKVVFDALIDVSKNGLPDDHHFYITFDTMHSHVDMPDYLREEYPDEMTIVLQHEFWDLEVERDSFQVTLCFDDANERLSVPLNSLISFVDPSVKFGLQFTPIDPDDLPVVDGKIDDKMSKISTENNVSEENTVSNVISFDSFKNR